METIPESTLVSTNNSIEGYKIVANLGLVKVIGIVKSGERNEDQMLERMQTELLQKAEALGGNAVVGVLPYVQTMSSFVSLLGTAVKVLPVK